LIDDIDMIRTSETMYQAPIATPVVARVRDHRARCASSPVAPGASGAAPEVAAIVWTVAVALPIAAVPALDIKAMRRRIRRLGFREFRFDSAAEKGGPAAPLAAKLQPLLSQMSGDIALFSGS
jgi:hypothetical protein